MKLIPLTLGKFAKVDEEDFDALNRFKWCAVKDENRWYATRYKSIKMHRVILGLVRGDGKEGDHWNGDGLDNQRENLRVATKSQNQSNRGKTRKNTSGFKGVYRVNSSLMNPWAAQITKDGVQRYLGLFQTKEAAYAAYCEAAKKLHREFRRL